MTRQILFKETKLGTFWSIFVDDKLIEDNLRNDEMNISCMGVLWKALDVNVQFEDHPDN